MNTARAHANTNIALVKYWGKRDTVLNLPAVSSLSMTLSTLGTTTEVTYDQACGRDDVWLDDRPAPEAARERVSRFLDLVREWSGVRWFARVRSRNNFPTASGLASSASGFAALAIAATKAAGIEADFTTLAALARRGSGSAPRSLLGGFVALPAGRNADGSDCVPWQVAPPDYWDLRLLVILTAGGPKAISSTEGMERTRRTSPYYPAWLDENAREMETASRAVVERDFETLGRVVEASCFRMHAVALSADPAVLYWNDVTMRVIHRVHSLREAGIRCFLTMDAGPHVKVLCRAEDADRIAGDLAALAGVRGVMVERPGPGAELLP